MPMSHGLRRCRAPRPAAPVPTALVALTLAAISARARELPDARREEVLVENAPITFDDAAVTGVDDVFHAKLSKSFREKFLPEKLTGTFKSFHDRKVDFDVVAAMPIVIAEPARVDDHGLAMRCYFDTGPGGVTSMLDDIRSDGEWRLIGLNVRVRSRQQ